LASHFQPSTNDWYSPFEVDFTTLNAGAWSLLCLYEGFESPQLSAREFAERNGLRITSTDQLKPNGFLALATIKEHERGFAMLDVNGHLNLLVLGTDLDIRLMYGSVCTTRDMPKLKLVRYES
jgi:hypothetical protein